MPNMKISFDKKLYHLKAVKAAAKAFVGLANFSFQENKKEITVLLSNIKPAVQRIIKDEFANYVLALIKTGE